MTGALATVNKSLLRPGRFSSHFPATIPSRTLMPPKRGIRRSVRLQKKQKAASQPHEQDPDASVVDNVPDTPPASMDVLSEDAVAHLLRFVSLPQVFAVQSVCKKWQSAADAVITSQDRLVIFFGKWEQYENESDTIFVPIKKSYFGPNHGWDLPESVFQKWQQRFLRMRKLRRFCVNGDVRLNRTGPECRAAGMIAAIIRQNGASLQYVCSDDVPAHLISSCLCLEELVTEFVTGMPDDPLGQLPVKTMKYLEFDSYLCHRKLSGIQEERDVRDALLQLVNLKELIMLTSCFGHSPSEYPLLKAFDNFTRLEKIVVHLPSHYDMDDDNVLVTIAANNPGLKSVAWYNGLSSDDALTALSRLTMLQEVDFDHENDESLVGMTTEGILTFLRGGSRRVIDRLSINNLTDCDQQLIEAELERIFHETGNRLVYIPPGVRKDPDDGYKIRIDFE